MELFHGGERPPADNLRYDEQFLGLGILPRTAGMKKGFILASLVALEEQTQAGISLANLLVALPTR